MVTPIVRGYLSLVGPIETDILLVSKPDKIDPKSGKDTALYAVLRPGPGPALLLCGARVRSLGERPMASRAQPAA